MIHRGSAVVDQMDDLAKLSAYTHIEGDLIINPTTSPHSVSFPNLREVSGSVEVWSGAAHELRFDNLGRTGGAFRIAANEELERVLAPRLEEIGGVLGVMTNPNLTVLDLGSLERVGDRADVSMNDRLSTCAVERIGRRLAGGRELFYYYENKQDGCGDHRFRFDEYHSMKRSTRNASKDP